MMTKLTPFGSGVGLCLSAATAIAVEVEDFRLQTTGDLVALCSAEPTDPMAAEAQQACYGYLAGTTDFNRALTAGERIKPFVCPGRELTRRELAEILVDWARDHAEYMAELPVEGVVRATVARFPAVPEDTGEEDPPCAFVPFWLL